MKIIAVSIIPNPAREYFSVKFFVDKEWEVTISLVDYTGKKVMVQKQKAAKDYNTTQLYGLAKCSAGIYTVMLFVNIELVNQKFVLTK
ncbi:T9SS type A sorting domain-containing protein [Ferruginibacter sp.]